MYFFGFPTEDVDMALQPHLQMNSVGVNSGAVSTS